MDECAEQVTAFDRAGLRFRDDCCWFGRVQRERTVRALAVVVRGVNANYALKVAAAEVQQPVEAFGADRADKALGVGCSGVFVDQSVESVAAVQLVWRAWTDEA